MAGEWSPRCAAPAALVRPVRLDPTGATGPTRRQAAGPDWRQTSSGRYVPSWVAQDVVEQRIVEQEARLGAYGAVTAWASLRWQGASYFEGVGAGGEPLPVPLAVGGLLRPDPRVRITRGQLAPTEWAWHAGLRCTTPPRALFDEVVRLGSLRPAVVAIDMAAAAGLLTAGEFRAFVDSCGPRNGVVASRGAADLARDHSWSPQEPWMRMCWTLDAGLPEPHCNVPVFDRSGSLLGVPDLFDEEAGVVGEYQGATHRDLRQHRRDVARAERFRDHALEYFEVVGGELGDPVLVATRMRQVRARARFAPPEARAWTLEAPAWWHRRQGRRSA